MAHGSLIDDNDWPFDQQRTVDTPPLSKHYKHSADDFIHVVWSEAEAMFRSLRRIDEVKMVCVDLDDTLWRGVLAETDVADIDIDPAVEGWPLGVAEALLANPGRDDHGGSAWRNEMIKSQIERETERQRMSRADFLAGRQLRARLFIVRGREDARFRWVRDGGGWRTERACADDVHCPFYEMSPARSSTRLHPRKDFPPCSPQRPSFPSSSDCARWCWG